MKTNMLTETKLKARAAVLLAIASLVTSACTNSKLSSVPSTSASGTGISNLITTFSQFTISGVSVNSSAGTTSNTGYPVSIQFQDLTTGPQLTSVCSTSGLPCVCKFSFTQSVTTGTTPVAINRVIYTPVTLVQPALVGCTTPTLDVWLNEIPSNTTVQISVVAGSGNTQSFTVNPYNYTKGSNAATGNFSDNQGNSYVNILRYTCYEQQEKGNTIVSFMASAADANITSFLFPDANRYCFYDSKAALHPSSGSTNCQNLSSGSYTYSNQANYFNFYVPSSEAGDINPGNSSFTCPIVKEALNTQSVSGAAATGTQNKYWPLDSSFALSLSQTATFNVGVAANMVTTNPADPTATSSACASTITVGASPSPTSSSGVTSTNSAIVSSCLGYAATPNPNGTCPSLTTVSGAPLPMYRLRRYIALYPPTFDTSGASLNQPQQVDTVYVIDRPVNAGTGKNYTMLGPKPCPFAYYDRTGETNSGISQYLGTDNALWTGKNIDGLQFPDADNTNSCTAVLPLPATNGSAVSLGTITAPRYIRPVDAWSPHYEEDTGFQACAPLANPLQDPPLHFAKGLNGNVSWCAEAYPSQSDNLAKLDPTIKDVKTYTSHVAKNSASTACTATALNMTGITGSCGSADYCDHTNGTVCDPASSSYTCNLTCDRTVVNPTNGINWGSFPLLAPAPDVEQALSNDSSFGCLITYDNSGASNGNVSKVGSLTPTQGCCGTSTFVWTGSPASPYNKTTAHLEPQSVSTVSVPSCATPNY